MNVYDFDKTIYNGDSTVDFYFYCLIKHPKIVFCIYKQIFGIILHTIKIKDTTQMKEDFFSFLVKIDDVDKIVDCFWKKNNKKIKKWYLDNKRKTDVIISASPEFLLRPLCDSLGIKQLIATDVNAKTGKITGLNCKGKEKVKRFYNEYSNKSINKFYSDSKTDLPLAKIAKEAFLIKGNKIELWNIK